MSIQNEYSSNSEKIMKKLFYILAIVGIFGLSTVSCTEDIIDPSEAAFENGGNGDGENCGKNGCD